MQAGADAAGSQRRAADFSSLVLQAPLPARWRPWQRRKNTLIYWAIRLLAAVLLRLPYGVVKLVALGLAGLAALVDVTDRRRALAHLELALPELPAKERRRIVRRMFLHLGRSVAEAVCLPRFVDGPNAVRLSPEQRLVFDAALAEGRGVVVVCGHIGNWELFGQVVARAGYDLAVIAKPTYDPRLTRLIHEARARFGMRVIWRGDNRSAQDMLGVFKEGGILALLVDQDIKVQGDFVPFFGRKAFTTTAPATLALRFGAPVIVAWSHRVEGGHAIHLERFCFEPAGDRADDVLRMTAMLNQRIEVGIRQHPEQWVWMHRRWRRQPDDVLREPEQARPARPSEA